MTGNARHRAAARRLGPVALALAFLWTGLGGMSPGAEARRRKAPKDPKAQAIEMVRFATALSNMGRYPRAIRYFKRALRLAPDLAGAWRNLGVAYESLKKWKEAEDAYEHYLKLAGNTGRFSLQVMARVNACRKEQGLPAKEWTVLGAPGKIRLEVSQPGSSVKLDGITRGSFPTEPMPVKAGPHIIEVSKVGFVTFVKSIVVKEGQTIVVRVELKRDEKYVAPRRRAAIRHQKTPDKAFLRVESDAPGLQVLIDEHPLAQDGSGYWVVPKPREHVVEIRAQGRVPWRARVELTKGQKKTLSPMLPVLAVKQRYATWAWVTLGVAAVAAATGGIFGALENKTYENVRDRRTYIRSSLEDMVKEGRLYGNVALGLYAAAGAALATSVALFVLERRGENPKGRPLPIVVMPTERGAGLAVSLSGEVDF